MATQNITYTDKEQGQINDSPIVQKWAFGDANEVKSVVNNNAAELTSAQSDIITNTNDIATKANDSEVVKKADYTPAHSLLVQQSGTGSPESLTVGNNTILGRKVGGASDIEDLSITDTKSMLGIDTIESEVSSNTAQFGDLNEQAVTSNLIEASVATTYTLDLTASRMWLLTLTADTTFSISALSNSTCVAFTVKLTGAFVPTLTDVNVYGDSYDGAVQNLLTFNSYRTAAGTQVNDLIITNLA